VSRGRIDLVMPSDAPELPPPKLAESHEPRCTCAGNTLGELASGIAHQLSTPVQLVAANLQFLTSAWAVLSAVESSSQQVGDHTIDPEFAREEGPAALQQSLAAIQGMAELLRTMKEWSDPGGGTRAVVEPSDALRRVVLVTEHRFRYTHELRLTTPAASVEMRCNRQHLVSLLAQVIAWVTAVALEPSAEELLGVELEARVQRDQWIVEARRGAGSSASDALSLAAVVRSAMLLGGTCDEYESEGTRRLLLCLPLCA